MTNTTKTLADLMKQTDAALKADRVELFWRVVGSDDSPSCHNVVYNHKTAEGRISRSMELNGTLRSRYEILTVAEWRAAKRSA